MVENAVVVVSGGIITGVGRSGSVEIPPGAERIELGDQTFLPGRIDGHTHAAGDPIRACGRVSASPVRHQNRRRFYLGSLEPRQNLRPKSGPNSRW